VKFSYALSAPTSLYSTFCTNVPSFRSFHWFPADTKIGAKKGSVAVSWVAWGANRKDGNKKKVGGGPKGIEKPSILFFFI